MLSNEADLEVVSAAADVNEELAALPEAKPDVVLMDLRFNGETKGIDATKRVKAMLPETEVIIFTGYLFTEVVVLRGQVEVHKYALAVN